MFIVWITILWTWILQFLIPLKVSGLTIEWDFTINLMWLCIRILFAAQQAALNPINHPKEPSAPTWRNGFISLDFQPILFTVLLWFLSHSFFLTYFVSFSFASCQLRSMEKINSYSSFTFLSAFLILSARRITFLNWCLSITFNSLINMFISICCIAFIFSVLAAQKEKEINGFFTYMCVVAGMFLWYIISLVTTGKISLFL